MKETRNEKIKESIFEEILGNGLRVIIVPKKSPKKYIIWGTHYGSNDNKFIPVGEKELIEVPNGIAHFLEHKLFEQKDGTNSLDTLTALGVSANAYTTNDHTAYLFESTDNFYEALDELMDYVQNPYFTDENVQKEQGIIGQEIMMYDDYPEWKVYLNAMKAMYKENPIRIDITGTIETIGKITKEILYKCYNTFYHPSNMTLVVCGDFKPEEILEEIKKRLIKTEKREEIKRVYGIEPNKINESKIETNMEVSIPMFVIGFKDKVEDQMVNKHIAIEILLNILIGPSSKLYKELYEQGVLFDVPDISYEFSDNYAYVMITGQSNEPEKIQRKLLKEIEEKKITEEEFERNKKVIYGNYVKEYNSVGDIARMFLADSFKGVNSFEYLEECQKITKQETEKVLKNVFKKENNVISIVRKK